MLLRYKSIYLFLAQRSNMKITDIVLLLLIATMIAAMPNQAPIIGIYTQEDTDDEPTNLKTTSANL